MRTPISRHEQAVGVFLALVLLLLTLALVTTGRRVDVLDAFREGYLVQAAAEEGHGAVVGSPVKVRGVEMGSVTRVELIDDPAQPGRPVRLTFRLRREAAAFLQDETVAYIIEPPLGSGMPPFGTAAVELRSKGTRPLAARTTIRAEGEPSMVTTMAQMSRDVAAVRGELLKAIEEMGSSFANLRRLSEALVDGHGFAGKLVSDPSVAGDLEAMLRDARATAGDMRRLMGEMNRVTTQVPAVIQDARSLSRDGQHLMARLDASLDALPRLVASTERTLALTEELLGTLKRTAGYAPELARKVDVSLDETSRLVEAAQRNFILRSTLPDRPVLRTEAEVRPPALARPSPVSSAPSPPR
jgi:ABC-type transporter Mla subunit MlaD